MQVVDAVAALDERLVLVAEEQLDLVVFLRDPALNSLAERLAGVDKPAAVDRSLRAYGVGAQILLDLGLTGIRPLTNNPKKLVGLEGYGLSVGERVPLVAPESRENAEYLETKRRKLGHLRAL